MTNKLNNPATLRDESYEDWLIESLKNPAEAAAYVDAVIDLNDAPSLMVALRQVAKAKGMSEVTRKAALGEKSLFKMLTPQGNPRISTMQNVLGAMGMRLSVTPINVPIELVAKSHIDRRLAA